MAWHYCTDFEYLLCGISITNIPAGFSPWLGFLARFVQQTIIPGHLDNRAANSTRLVVYLLLLERLFTVKNVQATADNQSRTAQGPGVR